MAELLRRLAAIARAPKHAFALLSRGDARLAELTELARRARTSSGEVAERTRDTEHKVARLHVKLDDLGGEVRRVGVAVEGLRTELRDRLLQYNLQIGRLSHAVTAGAAAAPARLADRPIPMELDARNAPAWEAVGEGAPHPDPDGREWLLVRECPTCGHDERTVVNEWNKLITLEKAPDETSARYDYAICHRCGVLYASRRPVGARFRYLLTHFGEVTGKTGGLRTVKNPMLNPYPLSDDDREHLRRLAAKGVFVSDHLGVPKREYLEGLIKDRFENSVHIDVLASLVQPTRARVLEVRPRTGAIADGLKRLFQADVSVLPIWESQQFLLKEVYGLDAPALVDFDRFTVPDRGPFDLVVCNHMFTHVLRPAEFFRTIREHLRPGGHLYLYKEPDDAEFLSGSQSMIVTLNPLHMQAFDQRSLRRALAACGFEVVFLKERNMNHLCLARAAEPARLAMGEDERTVRIEAYRRARDRAVLRVPESVRPRFAAEWDALVARGVADGTLGFDEKGHLRFVAN